MAGTALAGDMLSALVELDAKSVMSSVLQDADVISVARPHALCPCHRSLSCGCRLAQVLEQACNATRSDAKSYGPKQVAAWIAAKLVSAKYDASAIQQARGANFVCAIHSFSLFETLAKLSEMTAESLLGVTQDELQTKYQLKAASAEFLLRAVQGLSDPSATLACASHASFGGPVLRSVSCQLACFMAARALKGVDLS